MGLKTKVYLTVFAAVLLIFTGSIQASFSVGGEVESGVILKESRKPEILPEESLIVDEMKLKLNLDVTESSRLFLQLNQRGTVDLETGTKDNIFKGERYYLDYYHGFTTTVRLGKQRISWGRGFTWQPTDYFNPSWRLINYKEEEKGVLAATFNTNWANNSITLVGMPDKEYESAFGFKINRLINRSDLSLTGFTNNEQQLLGISNSIDYKNILLYTENSFAFGEGEKANWKGVVGANYMFAAKNNGMLYLEYYHNDSGHNDYFENPGEISQNLGKLMQDYISLGGNININYKTILGINTIYNLQDNSSMITSTFQYSWEKFELVCDGLLTVGGNQSEFGNSVVKNRYSLKIRRYF